MISRSTSIIPNEDVFLRWLYCDSRCSQACRWRSQACSQRSQMLPGLSSALPGAPRCTWRPLHRSSKVWNLTTLGFWSDNSQTLPEAPSDKNTFCWCSPAVEPILVVFGGDSFVDIVCETKIVVHIVSVLLVIPNAPEYSWDYWR